FHPASMAYFAPFRQYHFRSVSELFHSVHRIIRFKVGNLSKPSERSAEHRSALRCIAPVGHRFRVPRFALRVRLTLNPRSSYGHPHPPMGRNPLRNHQQTTQGLPVRNAGQERRAGRPRGQGASREAWPERSLSLRLRTKVSKSVACVPGVLTAARGTTFFRE